MTYFRSLVRYTTLLTLSMLALACQAQTESEPLDPSKYAVLNSPLTVTTGDKIEVMELFWFGCGHCFALEPHVKTWLKDKPDNAEFVKVPAVFSARWEFHAKAYYTMQELGILDDAEYEFFRQIHVHRKPINSLEQLTKFAEKYDKTPEQVEAAFNSFAVDTKIRTAKKISVKSTARGVPAVLVDGKYRTSVAAAGGQEQLFDVVNQLVEKAASER